MFIATAAVSRDAVTSMQKLLLALAVSYDFDFDANFRRKVVRWHTESEEFIKRFKLSTRNYTKAVNSLAKGTGPEDDAVNDAIAAIFSELKSAPLARELDISKPDLNLLNNIRLYAVRGSENAQKQITRVIGKFHDPDFNEIFSHDEVDTSADEEGLSALVKRFGKVRGLVMPEEVLLKWQDEAKTTGKKNPNHVKYLELRRKLSTAAKQAITMFVRGTGKKLVPIVDVANGLDAMGVKHQIPLGFVGLMDDNGGYYTVKGLRLKQPPVGDVRMNPKYNPDEDNAYVCIYRAPFVKGDSKSYTEAFVAARKQVNFGTVLEAIPLMPAAAKKWRAELSKPETRNGMLATLAEIIYQTSARVSSKGANTKGETTYGITTLQPAFIRIDPNAIHIRYTGKAGQKQHHIIPTNTPSAKRVAANLKLYMTRVKKNEPIFQFRERVMTGTMLTTYLRGLGLPAKFTIHMVRKMRATIMVRDILKSSPFKKNGSWDDNEVHKWLEAEVLKVGIELGHQSGEQPTANTAIQNYIEPSLLEEFYAKLGIRPSGKIQKAIDAAKKEKD